MIVYIINKNRIYFLVALESLGPEQFLLLYLSSGVIATAFSYIYKIVTASTLCSLGAVSF